MEAMENINGFQERTYGHEAGYNDKCGASKNVGNHAAALPASERYKIKAQTAKAAGKILTASLALFLEVKNMEVKHVLHYRQRGCMGEKLLEREKLWTYTMTTKGSWQEYAEGWEALSDNRWGI